MSTQIVSALAAFGLIGAGVAGAAETRAMNAVPMMTSMAGAGQAANVCRVDVVRTGTPGAADVTRAVGADGACVCTVTTGPVPSNGSAEEIVKALLRERTCDAAPLTSSTGANSGVGEAVSTAATSGGGSGAVIPVLVGAVGAAGLAVALSKDSKG